MPKPRAIWGTAPPAAPTPPAPPPPHPRAPSAASPNHPRPAAESARPPWVPLGRWRTLTPPYGPVLELLKKRFRPPVCARSQAWAQKHGIVLPSACLGRIHVHTPPGGWANGSHGPQRVLLFWPTYAGAAWTAVTALIRRKLMRRTWRTAVLCRYSLKLSCCSGVGAPVIAGACSETHFSTCASDTPISSSSASSPRSALARASPLPGHHPERSNATTREAPESI